MQIIKGKITKPLKVVLYGPEGVGKSTFASKFPDPLFIDTEDSTVNMDVARFPRPSSWTMLLAQVDHVKSNSDICKTLVIDTADRAETLCAEHICAKANVDGIEGFGWGKGFTYLEEEFGRFLNRLQEIIDVGINVVVNAHAIIKKIEQPEEIGGYDHWQMKLEKKTAPLLKEWADMILFANYKVNVINVDKQGAQKGKNKAQGGKRVMYTTHTPWWDAKNRHELADELLFDYAEIAHCIPEIATSHTLTSPATDTQPEPPPTTNAFVEDKAKETFKATEIDGSVPDILPKNQKLMSAISKLEDLIKAKNVDIDEVVKAVERKGYFPAGTPIINYGADFIEGCLLGAWDLVYNVIIEIRSELIK